MKKVAVLKAGEVEVKPLKLSRFALKPCRGTVQRTVTKKTLKNIAKQLQIAYDKKQIAFTKKLMNAYMKKEGL